MYRRDRAGVPGCERLMAMMSLWDDGIAREYEYDLF